MDNRIKEIHCRFKIFPVLLFTMIGTGCAHIRDDSSNRHPATSAECSQIFLASGTANEAGVKMNWNEFEKLPLAKKLNILAHHPMGPYWGSRSRALSIIFQKNGNYFSAAEIRSNTDALFKEALGLPPYEAFRLRSDFLELFTDPYIGGDIADHPGWDLALIRLVQQPGFGVSFAFPSQTRMAAYDFVKLRDLADAFWSRAAENPTLKRQVIAILDAAEVATRHLGAEATKRKIDLARAALENGLNQ